MELAVRNVVVAETFFDCEQLIVAIVWRYYREQGGCYDDWLAEAKIAYLRAYESFDPQYGTRFSSWLYGKLEYHLRNVATQRRRRYYRNKVFNASDVQDAPLDTAVQNETSFDLRMQDVCENISTDAMYVLKLLLDTPKELKAAMRSRKPRDMRKYIYRYLCKHDGWPRAKIDQAFLEVKGAL